MKVCQIASLAGAFCLGMSGLLGAAEIPGVGVKLAVSQSKPKLVEGSEGTGGEYPRICYRGEIKNGVLEVEPKLVFGESETDYLALVKAGGLIVPPTVGSPEYDLFFPAIDVRVVNNSKAPLHISRVDLRVAQSTPDPTPLPMVFGGYSELQYVTLFNEGWGKIEKADFEFDLVSKRPKGRPSGVLPFKRSLQRVTRSAVMSLHDELEKAGVSPGLVAAAREYREVETKIAAMEVAATDWEALEKDQSYTSLGEKKAKLSETLFAMAEKGCGPFGKGLDEYKQPRIDCWLHGWMTVSWMAGAEAKEMKLAVSCPVLVIPPDGLGAVGPVMGRYETMLSRDGRDYTLQVPVSHVVKPGGIARFEVTLGVPETSLHEFTVILTNADGKSIDGGKVRLAGLLPRAAEESLKTAAKTPAE